MPKYETDMRGVLFRNEDKKSEKHPDYKGNCEIGGVEFWLSAWLKEAESGRKYMSLSFQAKEEKPKSRPSKSRDPGDVPF